MQLENVLGHVEDVGMGLFLFGAAAMTIEILSRLNFWFDLKLSHFMIMLVGMAGGLGLIIRSFSEMPPTTRSSSEASTTRSSSLTPHRCSGQYRTTSNSTLATV